MAGRTLTAMEGESEESGAEDKPGGAAAGRDTTSDATSKDADAAGAGGRHGEERRETARVAGRQENPAVESSGVGYIEGSRGLRSGGKIRGGSPGSGRGSRVAERHRHPQSGRVARGDETFRVTPKDDRFPGADGQGRGADGNSPTTQGTKGSSKNSRGKEDGKQTGDGGSADTTAGQGRGR